MKPPRISRISDELAYVLPMGTFLLFTWAGGNWPTFFPWSYAIKTVLAAALLWGLRSHFTKVSWSHAWLGVVIGVVGLVQWVGMEKLLLHAWPDYPRLSHPAYNPNDHFAVAWQKWLFIMVRWTGASLVVPFMEEFFWRDFLWRTLIAPNNFKLAAIGEWDLRAFLIVAVMFGAGVHIEWMTAIVWGLMIGWLLVKTRSLGACIIAHAVTNFLLGAYVLYTHDWAFW